jgi:hypothetical protein
VNQLRGLTDDVLSGHLGFVEDGDDLLHVLAGAVLPTGERMRMPSEPNRNSGVTRNSNRENDGAWALGELTHFQLPPTKNFLEAIGRPARAREAWQPRWRHWTLVGEW